MAVPATPKLSDVVAEFGGPGNLKAYYRGGTYVPNIAANNAIATDANLLRLSQFAGATKVSVAISLTAHTIDDPGGSYGGQGIARLTVGADGVLRWSTQWVGSGSYAGEWATNLDSGANYECQITTTGGTTEGTTNGSLTGWNNLATDIYFQKSRILAGYITWTFTLAIRKVGTTTNLDSAGMTLKASGAGPGGDPCVVLGSWMDASLRVEDLRVGLYMDTFRPEEGFLIRPVEVIKPARQVACVKITTARGAILRCSESTPFNLRGAQYDMQDGQWRRATEMNGQLVLVVRDHGGDTSKREVCWEEVVEVESIGMQYVVPVSFGGRSFPAGDDPHARIFSHNMAKVPI